MPQNAHRPAVTLIELLITVLLIGIVTAVAVPRFADAICYHRAEAAARRLKADLEFARRRAETASISRTIDFHLADDSYTLVGVEDSDHPGAEYTVRLGDSPFEASIVSADFGGTPQLVFDGYGVPQSPGAVVIQAGAYQKTITVGVETGKPSIQ